MVRGEVAYQLIKEAGEKGITSEELMRASKLADPNKAVHDARKNWLSKGERIKTTYEKHSFLWWYGRRIGRYTLIRN